MANCTEQDVRRDAIAKAIEVFKEGSYNVTFKGNTVFVTPSLHPKSRARNMKEAIREANRKLEKVEEWAAKKFGEKFRKGWGEVGILPDKCQVTLRIPSKLGAAIKIQKEQAKTKDFTRDLSYYQGDEQLYRQEEDLSVGVKDKNSFESMINYLNGQIRFKASRISKITSEISELKRSGNKDKIKGKEAQVTKLHDDIEGLKKQIEEFETKLDADSLKSIAMTQLSWVNQILSKEQISPSELNEIGFIIDTWSNVKSIMYNEIEEIPTDMLQVFGEINHRLNSEDVFGNWYRAVTSYLAQQSEYKSPEQLLQEFYKISDVNFGTAYTLDLSRTGNKLLSGTSKLLSDANNRSDIEIKSKIKSIENLFESLKKKGKDTKIFWQVDKDGNPTGNLTNRYTQAWYDARKREMDYFKHELSQAKGNTTIVRRAYERRNKWLKDNTESIDIRYFVLDEFKGKKGEYTKKLKEQFGDKRTEEIIQQAVESYDRYKEALSFIQQGNQDLVDTGQITQEEANRKNEEWISENSPIVWFNQLDPIKQGEKRVYTQKFNRYIVTKPKVKYDNGTVTDWYDDNYSRIENDPDLMEGYKFIRELMTELMSYIPKHLTKDQDIHAGFLPRVKKELVDGISSKDFMGAMATVKSDFIDSITSQDGLDQRFLEIDPTTGMPYKNIRMSFLTNLPVDERSKDLEKVLVAFTNVAINYKWKSRVEDSTLLVNRFLNNVSKSEGRRQFTPDELTNMRKMLEYSEDVILYDKVKLEEGKSNKKIFEGNTYMILDEAKTEFINNKFDELIKTKSRDEALNELKKAYPNDVEIVSAKKKYKLLEEKRDEIEEKFYNKEIDEEEYNKLIKPLEEEASKLGKNLVFSKIGDKLLRVSQALALGFNPFSGANNLMFGITSNMMWASGRTDFSPKENLQALGLMWKSSLSLKDRKLDKVANLIAKFNILQETVEFKSDTQNSTLKKLKESPYILLRKGDYFIKGQTFIAMMLNTKIKDSLGNERSLFEAFDNEGNWKSSEFGEDKGWSGDVTNPEEMQSFLNFKNRVTQLVKKLHGNFDPKSPTMYKKYILGRMLGQFRLSWMAEGFASRFEGRKTDPYLDREIEGRYVTAYRLGIGKTLSILTKLLLFQGKKSFEGIRAQDRALAEENMRKLLMEIYLYAAMFSVYLLAKAAVDDDDDKNEGYMFAMNILQRTMADTTFYLSPNTFTSIINNPIPVLKVPMNAMKAFDSATELIFNSDLTDHESEQKWTNITNAFPYINQYNRFKYLTDRVIVRQ